MNRRHAGLGPSARPSGLGPCCARADHAGPGRPRHGRRAVIRPARTTLTGEASEAMANPSSGDPAKDLIGEWNLEESADGNGLVDSLLAFTEPRTRNRLDEGVSHRTWGLGAPRPAPDADLFGAFSINDDDEDDETNLAGPGCEQAS